MENNATYQIKLDEQSARITNLELNTAHVSGLLSNVFSIITTKPSIVQAVVVDERVRDYGLPGAQTVDAAGYDLRAFPTEDQVKMSGSAEVPVDSITLEPGQQAMVSTGLRVWINQKGYAGFMFARSGTGSKGLVLGNGTGVIDSDYQGPLKMCLWNRGTTPITINAGDRVAQLVIMPVMTGYQLQIVEDFEAETERGQGGFGSTGAQ